MVTIQPIQINAIILFIALTQSRLFINRVGGGEGGNPRPPTPPLMRFRKRRFSCWHEAGHLVGYRDAQRFCHTFCHSPILWQTSSFEQLLSTRPIPYMLYYQQPPGPFLRRFSPTSQVLWPRLTSVGSAMPSSMGYTLRCVPHRPPRIRCNSLHSM